MKILFVTSFLSDGGAEKWMLETVKNMDLTGLSIDYYFWCDIKSNTFENDYNSLGVKLYFRHLNKRKGKALFWLGSDFKKFIAEHGPYDVVHVNGTRIYQQMILMHIAKKMKIPVRMVHSHNSKITKLTGLKKSLRTFCRKQVLKDSTIVGGCSKLATVTKYGEDVLKSEKYFIFKNGIDYKKYAECNSMHDKYRDELKLGSGPVFLHIGRFTYQKNHPFLINIFAEIVKRSPDAKLILIGYGENQEKIFNMIDELNLRNNIIHVPYTSETEKYYSASDVYIFPSYYEGLPLVLLEAQASGIPCVISSNISEEVLVNDNIECLTLNDSYSTWADKAFELVGKRCIEAQENIYKAGYDVKLTAEAFLNCCKRKENK